jgi:cell division protein FtsW
LKKHISYPLLILTFILIFLGFLFLSTLSAPESLRIFGTTDYFVLHQLRSLIPAIILGIIAFFIPIPIIKKFAPYLLLVNLFLLLLVFIPIFGSKFWGAQRWIIIWGFVLQPSEFLKITSIMYLSAWISNRQVNKIKNDIVSHAKNTIYNITYILLPFLLLLSVISIILIMQPDLSTLGIIGLTLLAIYFGSKTPVWHTIFIILGAIGGLITLIIFAPYRLDRLKVFLNPGLDPLGIGLQVKQSLIAIGSGGFLGKGLGLSYQKFGFLPQAMTDSVFAILGEETGIVGCSILIILFLLFLWFGFKIAKNSADKFSKFTALGITFWITLQAFINIGSAIGIWPLAGIPLPFFSYGGSHLLTELVGVGLLLNISKNG